uniref:tRNA (adenine(58)-N(1))-methyltransferase non-catalytic subunit TRM6 n=1 Tax=Petromyzon marinus TaxID=7757 RepID=S4RXB8_PETMA
SVCVCTKENHSLIPYTSHIYKTRHPVMQYIILIIKWKVNFEKKWFFVDSLIGARYGTTFDITGGGDLQPLCPSNALKAEVAVAESGVDNRNIQSDGSAQKLTRDDISALKEQGLRGTEIVSQLVENSSTFKEKTEFSQEKYIKRKKKKYESHITVLKPNARLLATMYHSREPAKICHLR